MSTFYDSRKVIGYNMISPKLLVSPLREEGLYIGFNGNARKDDEGVQRDEYLSIAVYYTMAEIDDLIQALNQELGHQYQKLTYRQLVMDTP